MNSILIPTQGIFEKQVVVRIVKKLHHTYKRGK